MYGYLVTALSMLYGRISGLFWSSGHLRVRIVSDDYYQKVQAG